MRLPLLSSFYDNIIYTSEEVILVNRYQLSSTCPTMIMNFCRRVLRDDPSKSSMHNRQGLSVRMIIEVFLDWRLWPLYILGLTYMSKFSSNSGGDIVLTIVL